MAIIGTDLLHAKLILEKGELVAIPTETVYGLAANALNVDGVTKIFVAKNRPTFDPLIVHIASADEAVKYATHIPEPAKKLMERFWPGPLTLLLPKKDIIPDIVTSGLDRVGLRCPGHSLTLALLKELSFPLAAPSANPFGYVSPTTAKHVNDQLGNKLQYILDGGPCEVGVESTIVGWVDDRPVLYRLGGISIEDIESVTGKLSIQSHSTSQPQAPGQLTSHYAPKKKFLLGSIGQLVAEHKGKAVGILSFKDNVMHKGTVQLILSPSGNLEEASHNLFAMMRQFDAMDVDVVIAELVPEHGLGRAINDRLRRAAVE